jgi:hypothetical protein
LWKGVQRKPVVNGIGHGADHEREEVLPSYTPQSYFALPQTAARLPCHVCHVAAIRITPHRRYFIIKTNII